MRSGALSAGVLKTLVADEPNARLHALGARVRRLDYFVPPAGAGAEMLEGSVDEVAGQLVDLLKAKGGIK